MADIKANLEKIYEEIKIAEKNASREQNSVKLVAVSKFHPAESVIEAIKAGQTLFGENRVQEAASKFDFIRSLGYEADLHIIGSLQRNKAKEAVRIASCIESVDRIELMEELEKQCAKMSKNIQIYFEVHTGEDSKAGFLTEESLFEAASRVEKGDFPHLVPAGLMTMAPNTTDESLIKKSFDTLRELRAKMNEKFPSLKITELSMGMSNDFKAAIASGSTMVRIGTAIFGSRS